MGGLCLLVWPTLVAGESRYAQWSGRRQLALSTYGAMDVSAARTQTAPETQRETIVVRDPAKIPGTRLPAGTLLGSIEVPRLALSYVLLEGTDSRTLDKSVGHVEGTAAVGSGGNIGVAGHRDTHFRKLEWIRRDDEIVLTARDGSRYTYNVEWLRLFTPEDIEVLDEAHGPAVTVITCFPFEYVGSAPLRLVIRALPDEQTRARLSAHD